MSHMFAMRDKDHKFIKELATKNGESMAETLSGIIRDMSVLEQLRQSRDPKDTHAINLQLMDAAVNLKAEIETLKIEAESLRAESRKYKAIAEIVLGETQ